MDLKTVDNKRRIILPEAQPGEVYEVKHLGGGVYKVTRVRGKARFNSRPADQDEAGD